MGCDIHGVIQAKPNDVWVTVGILPGLRDYRSFSRLANVRNDRDITPISEPRGLPEGFVVDNSHVYDLNGIDIWLGDHSHSWLLVSEITSCQYDYSLIKQIIDITMHIELCDEDIRIVFGFDN
jgi:hypothetical protein